MKRYELTIEKGKEKAVINFLKTLDFVSIKAQKDQGDKKTKTPPQQDPSYFDSCPDWKMDIKAMRKNNRKTP